MTATTSVVSAWSLDCMSTYIIRTLDTYLLKFLATCFNGTVEDILVVKTLEFHILDSGLDVVLAISIWTVRQYR